MSNWQPAVKNPGRELERRASLGWSDLSDVMPTDVRRSSNRFMESET
jgi:hypothetical protein